MNMIPPKAKKSRTPASTAETNRWRKFTDAAKKHSGYTTQEQFVNEYIKVSSINNFRETFYHRRSASRWLQGRVADVLGWKVAKHMRVDK